MKRLVEDLPPDKRQALGRAVRVSWISLAVMAVTVLVVGLTMGSSQAMQAVWVEDVLSLVPPAVFLIAWRFEKKSATRAFPYGLSRVHSISFLAAAIALSTMGAFLVVDAAITLIEGEHPTIESFSFGGEERWFGWLMIGALIFSGVPPVILGRIKMRLAREVSDKVLHTDAMMNKADWMTASAGILGILGIGFGLWWADAAAAAFIAIDILQDGVKALRVAFVELADGAPRKLGSADLDPAVSRAVDAVLAAHPGAEVRVRETGRFFRFLIAGPVKAEEAERLIRRELGETEWRLAEVSIAHAGPPSG